MSPVLSLIDEAVTRAESFLRTSIVDPSAIGYGDQESPEGHLDLCRFRTELRFDSIGVLDGDPPFIRLSLIFTFDENGGAVYWDLINAVQSFQSHYRETQARKVYMSAGRAYQERASDPKSYCVICELRAAGKPDVETMVQHLGVIARAVAA
ncbi:MAG: hypothetical protein JST51_01600 [Armatimonadetes bacterium]|nr:hypothetical protein [Armatimonadota bacterium]